MSLHALAHNMAARGRGPDSTLVHMSPREVQGLQALAMANGGSLTINPQTGLPEAGFLDSLLPALAGFALNAFAPGIGGAIGGALGLAGTAAETVGAGLLVGGATGLATGSLEKGLMAGLGAYGGAGLGQSAFNASAAGKEAAGAAADTAISKSPSGTFDRLNSMKEGAGVLMNSPGDALKNNAWNIGFASSPLLAGTFDDQQSSGASKIHPGYIRQFKTDPATGRSYQTEAVRADEWGGRPAINWGGVPPTAYGANGGLMHQYADGGTTADEIKKGVPVWGGVGDIEPRIGIPENQMGSDSERAQRYLMGEGSNPFLFYHKASTVNPVEKAAEATKEIAKIMENQHPGGSGSGLSFEQRQEKNDPKAWANLTDQEKAASYLDNPNMLKVQETALKYWPFKDTAEYQRQQDILESAKTAIATRDALNLSSAGGANLDANKLPTVRQNPFAPVVNPDLTTDFGSQQEPGWTSGVTPAEQDRADAATRADAQTVSRWSSDVSGGGRGSDRTESGGYRNSLTEHQDNGDHTGSMAANGGLMDSRYAYGGGIAALSGGGMYNLGSYSDGGRLLRGPGDGVSDDIPATIGQNQPARLADGEFVVPARIVSELGNGSTEAGARKLYAMMDRVQKSRSKTVGKDKVAANSRADKYLPA